MFLQFYKPHPVLREIVNNIMISRVSFNSTEGRATCLFPPLPEQCLFFYPYDCMVVENLLGKKKCLSSCVIVGPQTSPVNLTMGYNHLVIKVGFQPGGLYRLLGIPMHYLNKNEAFDAADLMGKEIYSLIDPLRESSSPEEMQAIVEKFLIGKLDKVKQRLPIDHLLSLLIKHGGLLPVEQLAKSACLSNRQFERIFKDRVGLSPKFFSRLVRFANAWVQKESNPEVSWIEIAYTCGYYDQMHLIRDFKEFAAVNPSVIENALKKSPLNLQNKVFY